MKRKSLLALVLAGAILVTGWLPGTDVRANSTGEDFSTQEQRDELAELQRQEAELASNQARLDAEMQTVRQEVASLQSQSQTLTAQLDELLAEGVILQSEYDNLIAELDAAKAAMDLAIAEYETARLDVENKQAEYESRLVAMYKRSKQSPLEVLLDSDGITGFFTNLELLGVIGRSDQQILEELTAARETAEVKKTVAEDSKKLYEQFVSDKADEIDLLSQGIASTEDDLADLQSQILNRSSNLSSLEGTYYQNQQSQAAIDQRQTQIYNTIAQQAEATRAARAEATRAAQAEATRAARAEATRAAQAEATRAARAEAARVAQIRAAEATRKATADRDAAQKAAAAQQAQAASSSSSGFIFPAPGNTRHSSTYGWRPYPLNPSVRDFHDAIDFPGNFNDPIVAAKAGTVVQVSYPLPNRNYGGYGYANYVMIDHGDGYQTVYAHLKTINVSVGQQVKRGQRIGGMGSTGSSTGCHLHFEIRRPGYSANPRGTLNPYSYLYG